MSKHEKHTPLIDNQGIETGRAPPLPHELTAEWTVNAQLKFARAGEAIEKIFNTSDTVSPVSVLYKWTAVDGNSTVTGPQEPSKVR